MVKRELLVDGTYDSSGQASQTFAAQDSSAEVEFIAFEVKASQVSRAGGENKSGG